jgi:sec-independent protein translocase protein TatA
MLPMLGWQEILLIGAGLVIFFGARRLPDAVKSVKKSVKAFKGGLSGEDERRAVRDVSPQARVEKGSSKESE